MLAAAPDPNAEVTNPLYSTERYGNGRDIPASPISPPAAEMLQQNAIRSAANRARKLWPGPIGRYLWSELDWQSTSKCRHDRQGLTMMLVEAIMATPLPDDDPPAASTVVLKAVA